jgi:hypothetical protein
VEATLKVFKQASDLLNIEPRDLFSFERQMKTLLIFSKKIFEKNYKKGEKKRQTTNGTKAFQNREK